MCACVFYRQDERQREFGAFGVSTCFLRTLSDDSDKRLQRSPDFQAGASKEVEPRRSHRSLALPQNVFSNLAARLSRRLTPGGSRPAQCIDAVGCRTGCERILFFCVFFFCGSYIQGGVSLFKRSNKPRLCDLQRVWGY